jgi:hypothetical protein
MSTDFIARTFCCQLSAKSHGKLECRHSRPQPPHGFLLLYFPVVYVNQPKGYRCQFACEQNRVVKEMEGKPAKYHVGKSTTPWAKLEGVHLWNVFAQTEYFQIKSREWQFVWNMCVNTWTLAERLLRQSDCQKWNIPMDNISFNIEGISGDRYIAS